MVLARRTAGRHRGRQPVALITHKPVTATGTELAAAPPYRFWPPPARARLARLFGGTPPALVMSGHVHQYRLLRLDGADHRVGTDDVGGSSRPGAAGARSQAVRDRVTDIHRRDAGQAGVHRPDGLEQHTVTVDLPDPYHN